MITTEIHTAISLNPVFANMTYFLVKSIAKNSDLPGPWKVVVTVSRDTDWDLNVAELSWARQFPVEFKWVNEELWKKRWFHGTGQQALTYQYEADVVLHMDADVIVKGSLFELVIEIANSNQLAAWPAWMPPPNVDLDALIDEYGLKRASDEICYSGYAIDFMEPKYCPPYFNFGFVAVSQSAAQKIAQTFADDMDFVCARHDTSFACQIALCLSILRSEIPVRILDERYNYGNGEFSELKFSGPITDAAVARSKACSHDIRILHYLTRTEKFQKFRDLVSLDALREFCEKRDVGEGNAMLQREFKLLLQE